MSERAQGTVSKWIDDKGYGFISVDGTHESVFVHYTDIEGDWPQGTQGGRARGVHDSEIRPRAAGCLVGPHLGTNDNPIAVGQEGRPIMVSSEEVEAARLSMLEARKALEDYETLKGTALPRNT